MKQAVGFCLLFGAVAAACDTDNSFVSPTAPPEGRDEAVVETVYAGTAKTRAVVELADGVRIETDGERVTMIEFDIALARAGAPLPIVGYLEIDYIDAGVQEPVVEHFSRESGDGDGMLEPGESATIRILMETGCPRCAIGAEHTFTLEIKPPNGSYLVIQRTTPASLPDGAVELP